MDHVIEVFQGGTDEPVRLREEVAPIDAVTSAQMLRDRARTIILDRFPDWKQANMTARGVELQDIMRCNGEWTPQEQTEADALQAAWTWIAAVRARSNELQAADEQGASINYYEGTIGGEGGWPPY